MPRTIFLGHTILAGKIKTLNVIFKTANNFNFFRDAFCSELNTNALESENLVPLLKQSRLFFEIQKTLDPLILKADRVSYNETTNQAER